MRDILLETFKVIIWLLVFTVTTVLVIVAQVPESLQAQSLVKSVALVESGVKTFDLDWWPAQVAIRKPTRTLKYLSTEFSIKSNDSVTIRDLPSGWEFFEISKDEGFIHYLLKTRKIKNGSLELDLKFEDQDENVTIGKLQITAPAGREKVTIWPKAKYYMPGDSLLAMVNKQYRLPEDYAPQDLVKLQSLGISNINNARLRKEAADMLKEMTKAIEKAKINYLASSTYRSYSDQVRAYNYWLSFNNGNIEVTDTVSARPGHSEHQLGTTIDFTTSENEHVFYKFGETILAKWLAKNAYRYGFVLSYPKGKESITGYTYEPWHYRYIGVENALKVKKSKLTLTEWLLEQNEPVE